MTLLRRLWDCLFSSATVPEADPQPGADQPNQELSRVALDPASPDAPALESCWWMPGASAPQNCSNIDEEPEQEPAQLDSVLQAALESALRDGALELPRLPHVTDRALLMLRGDNADYRALSKVISEDPAITAQILRVANSAACGGVVEIRSLEQAFARLGQRTVRSVILSASLRNLSIRVGGAKRTLGEAIWRRSVASGVIMSASAKRCGVDENDAFVAGLLHDIGHFVVLMMAHDAARKFGAKLSNAVFERLATQWHEAAGLRLAESWQLPAPLPSLIADHHRVPADDDPNERLRLLILFADVTASLLGYAPYHPYDFFATPCVQRLGFTDTRDVHAFLLALPDTIEDRIEST